MESKYLIFLAGALIFVPIGILIARSNQRVLNFVFIVLVFGTTQPESLFGLPTDINFLSKEWYRGTTRGIEISYLDLLAIILFFGSLSARAREGVAFRKPPSYGIMKVYFLWSLFTVLIISDPKIFGLFEVTKIGRGIFIFLAIAAFIRSTEQLKLFAYVLILVSFYEAGVALYDRYFLGIHRIRATMPHPNSLSMYCLQILPITISIYFAENITPRMKQLSLIASLLLAGTIILTISRTGFATMALIAFFALVLNIHRNWNPRNFVIFVLASIIGVGMAVKSWDSLSSRFSNFDFENEYLSERGDRGSYFHKGMPAVYENPVFGFGLNNWSYWISNKYAGEAGYYSNQYPSTNSPPLDGPAQPPAHNLYLITATEIGLVGLILLLAIFYKWLKIAFSGVLKGEMDISDRIRLGAFLGLLGVLMQSVTEWEFRQTPMFFLEHIIMGVVASIYYQRKKDSET